MHKNSIIVSIQIKFPVIINTGVRSFRYIKNKRGLKILPWGTPQLIILKSDEMLLTETCCCLHERKDCLYLCSIGLSFNQMLLFLFFVYNSWNIRLIDFVWPESFCERNDSFLFWIFINNYKDRALFRKNDFLPLYCACNLTSNIQILVKYSQCTFKQI